MVKIDKYEIILFGFALVLRLLFMYAMSSEHESSGLITMYEDSIKYEQASEYLFGNQSNGEFDLFLVGPGYPFIMGTFNAVFDNYWILLLVQTILSSLAIVLIYRITNILLVNKYIAILSGVLGSISMTSISLSNSILTDSFFFFFLVLTIYLFINAAKSDSWPLFIVAGIIGGTATLIRSVSLFYPFVLIAFAFLIPLQSGIARKNIVVKSIVLALIMSIIPSIWAYHNYSKYQYFTVAGTGTVASKVFLSSKVAYLDQKRPPYYFRNYRDSVYNSLTIDIELGKYKKIMKESSEYTLETFKNHSSMFIKTYFINVLYNTTHISTLQNIQTPQFEKFYDFFKVYFSRGFSNTINLFLTFVGFAVLVRFNWRAATILIINVLYFALLSGVTFGQGSRIFFPAQSTDRILWAAGLLFLFNLFLLGLKSLKTKTAEN